ncbi:hypothetical protein [Bartonella sp. A05]|uniref:hypothetical protein n=1 Tax=Bartonella sp. A05 TaxID=2967261 RepID=UPI0022A95B93|nr:hypothetical protein [Bartonella sp. A05]MCZ2204420.1 hypothetical protein [Bartonella sp. A05]
MQKKKCETDDNRNNYLKYLLEKSPSGYIKLLREVLPLQVNSKEYNIYLKEDIRFLVEEVMQTSEDTLEHLAEKCPSDYIYMLSQILFLQKTGRGYNFFLVERIIQASTVKLKYLAEKCPSDYIYLFRKALSYYVSDEQYNKTFTKDILNAVCLETLLEKSPSSFADFVGEFLSLQVTENQNDIDFIQDVIKKILMMRP